MERLEDKNRLDEALTKAIGSEEQKPDFENWKQQHLEAVEMLTSRAGREAPASPGPPMIRRIIMKSPITKLAVAAAVIAVVVLGLFEFIGTEGTSSVVWAEVARKVQASRGLIVRCTSESIPSNEGDYTIKYMSPTHSRSDTYKGGQITRSFYLDFDTKTFTGVFHTRKHYLIDTFTASGEGFLAKHEDWMNPRYLVETILSCEHRKLGQKTMEGVLCEGIETTDPPSLGPPPEPVDRLEAQYNEVVGSEGIAQYPVLLESKLRLWVNMETQYPVLLESKISTEHNGEVVGSEGVMDQFQWDVELDASLFEPNIPLDYTDMRTM
ncbi:MAG: hypothetical protein FVQ85_11995 [Planctomycetes bacterium]|nr:hypothetical protein [Planctomycetota bacterium]